MKVRDVQCVLDGVRICSINGGRRKGSVDSE